MTAGNQIQRVFIYGSCVARDTAEYLPENYRVMEYVARHSLLSWDTDASYKLPDSLELSNKFQDRMLRADWAGNSLDSLIAAVDQCDLILWDIFDERHGVHWFSTGEVVTRSIDLVASKPAMGLIEEGTHVALGAEEHFQSWCEKADEFITALTEHGALDKVRVLRVPWAERTSTQEPTPVSMGISAQEANKLTGPYYDYLAQRGVPIIEVPADLAVADPVHQWGLAPFHYVPEVYHYLRDAIVSPAPES